MIKPRDAFTLVELLVVIAIIGILSGLIIVGMNSSVQQATTAKAQIFSTSLRDSLLANLISEWKFDDSTNLGKDSWSTNNCSNVGSPGIQTIGCMYGSCLSLDGTAGNYLSCGNANSLNINSAMTIEAWINPVNLSINSGIATRNEGSGDDNAWTLYLNTNTAYFSTMAQDLTYRTASAGPLASAGRFYHVVGTFDGINVRTYLNTIGGTIVSYAATTTIRSNANPTLIGMESARCFNGLIDNVRIYNTSIPVSQIKEHYYSGIKRLLAVNGITKTDYYNRINELLVLD